MFAVFGRLRKSFAKAALALAATAALAACQATVGGGPSINTSKPVPVALLVPAGSGAAGDEVLARSLENAARLAMADLQGVQIDLRVYNTAANAEIAANEAVKAVNDGAKIILGPVYAQSALAVGNAVAGRNINVLSFSNNSEIAGGNVFVLGPTFQNTANRLVRYAANSGRSNLMVVRDQNVSGQAGAQAIQTAATLNGATVVGEASYEFSQTGVIDAIPTIADTTRESGAQAIFFTANTSGALPLLAQLLPENRIDPAQIKYIGLTRWDIPASTLSLPGVQGGWFALPDPNLTATFNTRYEGAFGQGPHPIAGLAYDGIAAIGALVAQGNSDALTGVALTQSAGFAGVNGVFRLLSDGTNERGLAIAEIQESQVVVIDPAPRSFGGPGL